MSVVDYIIKMNLTSKLNGFVPTQIDLLLDLLDENGINIWNYCEEDVDEIKDMSKVVLVEDSQGNRRYFELEITESY